MKKLIFIVLSSLLLISSCKTTSDETPDVLSFRVTFSSPPSCGLTEDDKCDFSLENGSFTAHVKIEALNPQDQVNTQFYRSVVVSTVPSGMFEDNDPNAKLLPNNKRVLVLTLNQGVWEGDIKFVGAFSEVNIIVEDMGYEPAADALQAACQNIYPGSGCYAPDDDNPDSGTGSVGVSPSLYFKNPLLRDIQKPKDESKIGQRDADISPLAGFRVYVDGTPFEGNDTCAPGESRLVVTQVGVAGFFLTDVCSPEYPDYASLYVFNFNTPEDLHIGDCITSLQGGIDEFQGFTEMKNPFWTVDYCESGDSFCYHQTDNKYNTKCFNQIPAPIVLTADMLNDPVQMEKIESALVEVSNVTSSDEFRVCDANGNGVIEYEIIEEKNCKYDCGDEVGCVVKEDFDTYFTWTINVDGVEVGVVSRGVIPFDPEDESNLGRNIYKIRGNLKHLDFGSPPWIIIPRNTDDFCLTSDDCSNM